MGRRTRVTLGVLLALLALAVLGPLIVPVPPLQDTVDARTLADAESRFVEADGIEVHYRETGQGTLAIVLMHGFGASTFSWREVTGPLAERGRVIVYDRPAFGLTERPMRGQWDPDDYAGGSPYSPEAQADLAIALMDALGIDRAVLVGHSAGGSIAMIAALRHPERVEALVLVDAAVYTEGGPPAAVYPLLSTPQLRRIGPLVARSIGGAAGDRFLDLAWHDATRITDEVRAGYRTPLAVDDWDRALWELTIARSPQRLGERVSEISCPTLVVTGDDDRIVPTDDSRRLVREIPGAELAVVEDAGHVPHEEQPTVFVNAVYRFLDTLPLAQEGCLSSP
jgi:pimeloyl-ACP methyl ester carboxylesterase